MVRVYPHLPILSPNLTVEKSRWNADEQIKIWDLIEKVFKSDLLLSSAGNRDSAEGYFGYVEQAVPMNTSAGKLRKVHPMCGR